MRVTAWLVVILFVIRPSFWNPGPIGLLLVAIRTCGVCAIGVSLILSANCFRDSSCMARTHDKLV
jgi:hypothetical protein